MERRDPAKIVFVILCAGMALGIAFGSGLYSGARKNVVYDVALSIKGALRDSFRLASGEATTVLGIEPSHFLAPATYQGAGVTVDERGGDDLILLSGFFEDSNELRLIRRDGEVVRRWPVSFHALFPSPDHVPEDKVPKTDWNIDLHGALALPDGSVVFSFEYVGTARLDRCGNVLWTLERPTHHSVERAEAGGFWIPGRRWIGSGEESPFPPFQTPLIEDTILRVADDGRVVEEISVPALFYGNGLEPLLTATGEWFEAGDEGGEIVHLNKVEELGSDLAGDFPLFEAGDLALSIRESNLIMVVAPEERKIKWWQIGPWVRQHDPEFKGGGTIALFNNNLYRTAFGPGPGQNVLNVPKVSNVMEIEPSSNRVEVVVGADVNVAFGSVIRGKLETLEDGGFLVTEFQSGRVFETDRNGTLVWEYINRYDDEHVAELTEARLYPRAYFEVEDWSCP